MNRTLLLGATLACLVYPATPGAAISSDAAASNYPVKPIRFIVPYTTGGSPDMFARMIGSKLTEAWGQQVIVDNRAGANGVIACETTARSPNDGYTIQMGSVATHAINPALYAKIPYDPVKDFSFVTQVGFTALLIVAHPSVQASTVPELIALAKAKPGYLTFGSPGIGSAGHLAAEMFKAATGTDLTHVPYKGITLATIDLLSGQIRLTLGNLLPSFQFIKAGKLKAIGVTSLKRSPLLPDTAAIAETVPGFEVILWWGIFAPAKTPRPIIGKLHSEIVRILRQPEFQERWAKEATVITGTTPEELAALVKVDRERWAKVVKSIGVRAD